MKALLGALAGNRALIRLELSWAAASLVRWALVVLVALYAYRTGGPQAVGIAAVARIAPAAILAPRLSLVADRRSKRLVLVVSMAVRLALSVAMALGVAVAAPVWVVVTLAAAWGIADAVHKPAQVALMAAVARDPAELAAANALSSVSDNGGFLAGSIVVGAVVATWGLTPAFVVCAIPLALALPTLLALHPDVAHEPVAELSTGRELLEGLRVVWVDRQLRLLVGLRVVDMFVQAIVDVLVVVIALGLFSLGEQGAGWLNAWWGAGGVLGAVAATVLMSRNRLPAGLGWGLVLAGLPLVAMGIWPHPWLAVPEMLVLGLGYAVLEVALLTLGQRLVAADVMARVYGVEESTGIAAMALGSLAASLLLSLVDQRSALVITGAALPVVAALLWLRLRGFDSGSATAEGVFEHLRGVRAFAPLSVATVQNLAARTVRRQVEAGSDVVRQGEHGDEFFVIESGDVDVFEDGAFRRTESVGEQFGEIALLRDVRRTATVRARTDVTLLVLGRDEFLTAIGAHVRTRLEMERVAGSRLDGPSPG